MTHLENKKERLLEQAREETDQLIKKIFIKEFGQVSKEMELLKEDLRMEEKERKKKEKEKSRIEEKERQRKEKEKIELKKKRGGELKMNGVIVLLLYLVSLER